MSIDQQCSQHAYMNATPSVQTAPHDRIALEQSASYQARLAITRWSNSSSEAMRSAQVPVPQMGQAQWYAKTQREFQEWLGRGGFAQQDIGCAEAK